MNAQTKTSRRIAAIASLAVVGLALAGCGGASAPAEESAASSDGQLEGTLTVYGWSAPWDQCFQAWSAEFKADTGVDVVYVAVSGLATYSRLVSASAAPKTDLLLSSASYLSQAYAQALLEAIDYDALENAA